MNTNLCSGTFFSTLPAPINRLVAALIMSCDPLEVDSTLAFRTEAAKYT